MLCFTTAHMYGLETTALPEKQQRVGAGLRKQLGKKNCCSKLHPDIQKPLVNYHKNKKVHHPKGWQYVGIPFKHEALAGLCEAH